MKIKSQPTSLRLEKNFRLEGGVISSSCPECSEEAEVELKDYPLSWPPANSDSEDTTIVFCCSKDHEWQEAIQITVSIEESSIIKCEQEVYDGGNP